MRRIQLLSLVLLAGVASSCVPKNPVVLRKIRDIVIEATNDGHPLLRGTAILYNPNGMQMKLREVSVDVFVDGKKSAHAEQTFNSTIPAKAEFTVPLEITLSIQKQDLLGTFLDLLGGKKYKIHYVGYVKVRVHGVPVKVPIDYQEEISIKI